MTDHMITFPIPYICQSFIQHVIHLRRIHLIAWHFFPSKLSDSTCVHSQSILCPGCVAEPLFSYPGEKVLRQNAWAKRHSTAYDKYLKYFKILVLSFFFFFCMKEIFTTKCILQWASIHLTFKYLYRNTVWGIQPLYKRHWLTTYFTLESLSLLLNGRWDTVIGLFRKYSF